MVEHRLELFRELALGTVMNQAVFLDAPRAGRKRCSAVTFLMMS
jgi:hypothetical protein